MAEETPDDALSDGDELFEHHRIVADKRQSLLLMRLMIMEQKQRKSTSSEKVFLNVLWVVKYHRLVHISQVLPTLELPAGIVLPSIEWPISI